MSRGVGGVVRGFIVRGDRTSRLVLAGACLSLLVLAAVLSRPGTAVDEAEVAAARASLAPVVPSTAPAPAAPLPQGALVVRADGVDGLRLGMSGAEVTAAGFSLRQDGAEGCRRVLPGLADAGPGPGVAGWLVGDRVAAVTVDDRSGDGSSFLGPGPGGLLVDLPVGDGLVRASSEVTVPWQPEPRLVDVARVEAGVGVSVSFADLDSDGDIDHVQVLDDRAAGCPAAQLAREAEDEDDLPVLTADGWGDVRIGTPLAEAVSLLDLQPALPVAPYGSARCRLLLADAEPGLVHLIVGTDDEGVPVVRAIAVDAGRTDTGLSVGVPAERVRDHYPGITQAFLDDRWDQGLVAEWQFDGTVLRLAPTRERVPVPELDAVLDGPRNVLGIVQLGPGC